MPSEINSTKRILHICLSIMSLALTVAVVIGIFQVYRLANAATSYLETLQEHRMRMKENASKFSSTLSECLLYMFVTGLEEKKVLSATEAKKLREQSLQAIKKQSPRWRTVIEAMGMEFVKSFRGVTGGIETIKRGEELYWVKCNNKKCNAEYQIDKKDYYEQIEEKMRANPMAMVTPPLTCKECGEPSALRAVKCEKCDHVFFYGADPTDFADRCPECGHSKTEADRKARAAQRGR